MALELLLDKLLSCLPDLLARFLLAELIGFTFELDFAMGFESFEGEFLPDFRLIFVGKGAESYLSVLKVRGGGILGLMLLVEEKVESVLDH
jgi:hypothetical protein